MHVSEAKPSSCAPAAFKWALLHVAPSPDNHALNVNKEKEEGNGLDCKKKEEGGERGGAGLGKEERGGAGLREGRGGVCLSWSYSGFILTSMFPLQ